MKDFLAGMLLRSAVNTLVENSYVDSYHLSPKTLIVECKKEISTKDKISFFRSMTRIYEYVSMIEPDPNPVWHGLELSTHGVTNGTIIIHEDCNVNLINTI